MSPHIPHAHKYTHRWCASTHTHTCIHAPLNPPAAAKPRGSCSRVLIVSRGNSAMSTCTCIRACAWVFMCVRVCAWLYICTHFNRIDFRVNRVEDRDRDNGRERDKANTGTRAQEKEVGGGGGQESNLWMAKQNVRYLPRYPRIHRPAALFCWGRFFFMCSVRVSLGSWKANTLLWRIITGDCGGEWKQKNANDNWWWGAITGITNWWTYVWVGVLQFASFALWQVWKSELPVVNDVSLPPDMMC